MFSQYYKEKQVLADSIGFKEDERNSLALFLSHNTFIYAISSSNFNAIHKICHVELVNIPGGGTFSEKIESLITNYQLHKKKFEKVIISILNKDFTIVPEAYSDSSDLREFLSFSSGIAEVKKTLMHSIKNVKFCYTFDSDLQYYLEKTFAQAIIKHAGAVNMELFFSNHTLMHNNLFLSINDGLIEIASKEKNDLLFYNVFSYENNEDILYYLLFMMEQFNLNPLHVKLAIAGQLETTSELITSIKKYIKQVSFVANDSKIKLEGELAKLPAHNYFTVLNQHLCV